MTLLNPDPSPVGQIRPMNLQRDLNAVADLIEDSFDLYHDIDGQAFIQEMRQAAKEMNFFSWAGTWQEVPTTLERGYVWVEQGRVVGNISLISFKEGKTTIVLIANVAVQPAFRRRGIARKLTERALLYLKGKGIKKIWLQVNVNNPAAIQLYQSLGFITRFSRTTWHRKPAPFTNLLEPAVRGLSLCKRNRSDYPLQNAWLSAIYPPAIRWHFQVNFSDFSPLIWLDPTRWGELLKLTHWSFNDSDGVRGFITRQRTQTFADALYPAFDLATGNEEMLKNALSSVLSKKRFERPLSIEFPMGEAEQAFLAVGFYVYRSLYWMQYQPGF